MRSFLRDVLEVALRESGWELTELSPGYAVSQHVVADAVARVRSGGSRAEVLVEVSAQPRPRAMAERGLLLKHEAGAGPEGELPVAFFVPQVTPGLARALRDVGAGYFDLYGTCYLRWPGLFVDRQGRDKPVVPMKQGSWAAFGRARGALPPGLPGSEVEAQGVLGSRAVKSHRVLRAALSYHGRKWHQTELAQEADVSVYTAHRVVEFLLAQHYADWEGRGPEKVVFLVQPVELIETWATFWRDLWQRYRRGAKVYHCLAANTDEVVERLEEAARKVGARLGLTLAAGANQYGAYLFDEIVHAYLLGDDEELAEAADLDAARRAGNVVLYDAADPGVVYLPDPVRERLGTGEENRCTPVSPVQLYLDMKAAGGRYAEQAERLRQEVLAYR